MSRKCAYCGAEAIWVIDSVDQYYKSIGTITIENIRHLICVEKCGFKSFPVDEARKFDEAYKEILEARLKLLPIGEWITSEETQRILGISRQKLNAPRGRIQRGFIYYTKIGKKKYYHHMSVDLYKTTGDGRFPL